MGPNKSITSTGHEPIAEGADLLSFWDTVPWSDDPMLAFAYGIELGKQIERDAYSDAHVAAYRAAFVVGRGATLTNHFDVLAQNTRRAEADTPGARDGDYTGRAAT